MYTYTVDTIEKAMLNALSIYHPNNKAQALKFYNDTKRDVLNISYKEAKRRSSQSSTRLCECLWLLNEYKKKSYLPERHIKIPFSKRIETFNTVDRRLQFMPEVLKEALVKQAEQKEASVRQATLREKHAFALRQKRAHDRNISYLKKIPPSSSPKRRPKF